MSSSPAVTVVIGEEEVLAQRAISDIVTAANEAAAGPEVVAQVTRAGELPEGFAMELSTASLFGETRVLVIRDAERLDADMRGAILAVARDPLPGLHLVVWAASVGRLTRFFQDLAKLGRLVRVPRLKAGERVGCVRTELQRRERRATPEAVAAIAEITGEDLRGLLSAVEKVALAVPAPDVITADDVLRHIHRDAQRGVFEFADAIVSGNIQEAMSCLDALLRQGEEPLGLLAILARQLRLGVRVAATSGRDGQVASALGIRDWQVQRLRRLLRGAGEEGMQTLLRAVACGDLQVRTGELPGDLVLHLLAARAAELRARN